MHTKLTNHPVEQVIAAIQALDLEPVKLRVMDPKLGEGWSREYAESIEQAYKNYLTMLVKYQDDAEDILLAEDVDEFWHTHILQTIKYTKDCEAVFGKYLHHNPYVGELTPADIDRRVAMAEKTRRLYQQDFGGRRDHNTAPSWTSLKTENAAMCAAAIQTENTAMCAAAVRAEDAAMCAAAVRAEDAAMCAAAIQMEDTAMCAAAVPQCVPPLYRWV